VQIGQAFRYCSGGISHNHSARKGGNVGWGLPGHNATARERETGRILPRHFDHSYIDDWARLKLSNILDRRVP
jgi:hypothetical protein